MTPDELRDLRTMTVPQIRRAQHLVALQLTLAYEQRNTAALTKLQEWEQDYFHEMMGRTCH
jgi:hypothetical protein